MIVIMSLETIRAYKKVGERRFRECHGLYYEDIVVGEVVEHRPGRTVTEADNIWQSLLAVNLHPLHIDAAYAEKSEWGRPLVSSLVTLSIVTGMSVNSTSARGIANLGWEEVRLLQPVFVGDTLYAESEFLKKRLSRSRPTLGLVTCETRGSKADGTVFLTFRRTFLVPTREHALDESAGY
jgi:itaconyl-CoA hydratase